ncbi:hypothetical protein CDAR_174671 [Caerostris darwini]|uniref:Uncharacterized protein n=1 Tax=Caerostris darwini TaxID=1538125 RepID=A0AAV4WW70_9ARAC|nr:hypothetical protein CDAR_174671 [Caerostris darwini]
MRILEQDLDANKSRGSPSYHREAYHHQAYHRDNSWMYPLIPLGSCSPQFGNHCPRRSSTGHPQYASTTNQPACASKDHYATEVNNLRFLTNSDAHCEGDSAGRLHQPESCLFCVPSARRRLASEWGGTAIHSAIPHSW